MFRPATNTACLAADSEAEPGTRNNDITTQPTLGPTNIQLSENKPTKGEITHMLSPYLPVRW